MSCDRYLELFSLRLDGPLAEEEEQELEEHLRRCPDCRAAGAQLAALRAGFGELEDISAPEGFAQGVMERIRAEERPKVIPLFKRPQVRALTGLAACLVLVVGLYSAARFRHQDLPLPRSYGKDAVEEMDEASACEALTAPELEDVPQIAAYAAPSPEDGSTTEEVQKAAPNPAAGGIDGDWAYAEITLTLDRMPEGGWELIPPDTFVSPVGLTVSVELLEQLEQLASEQGIGMSRVSGPEVNNHCLIIILNEES